MKSKILSIVAYGLVLVTIMILAKTPKINGIPIAAICAIFSFLSLCIGSFYLMVIKKSRRFDVPYIGKLPGPLLLILSMFFSWVGIIYLVYKFHKRPIRNDETDSEFESRMIKESRLKKISKII